MLKHTSWFVVGCLCASTFACSSEPTGKTGGAAGSDGNSGGDPGAIITDPGDAGAGPSIGGTNGSGGSGGSRGVIIGRGGSGGRPGTAGSDSGGSSSGGVFSGACTASSPTQCVGATSMNLCVNGAYAVMTCAELTGEIGFDGTACTDTVCELGQPIDEACATGVALYCVCTDPGTCTDPEFFDFYAACYLDDPAGRQAEAQCLADYVVNGEAMCDAAFTACSGAI